MIRIEHIKKKFRKLQALDGYQCAVSKRAGDIIDRSNGSGKTTLIKSHTGNGESR